MKTLVKISIFIVFLYNWAPGIAQTQISGIINRYAAVISSNGTDNVTVDNATGFATGDTVLIIQMRGATFEPLLNNALSNIQYTGRYEFIAVQQVNGNQIKFRSNLINTYDPSQAIQIVRVPYYQSAKVTGTLTCTPWDSTSNSSKGGVLALIVGDTLELTADIDVSNNGFLGGGKTANGNTICYQYTNQLNYSKYAIDSAGLKGSGIVQVGYAYTRGLGELGNAGGGGNGFGSGGGGGAGYGVGGNGGQASSICPDQNPLNLDLGGYGGQAPKDYFAGITNEQRDRIFMGGGGGAGRGQYLSDGTNGANGGGIVFIIARNLKTNNYYLRSNGGNVTTNAVNQAGAGGGGGGGSILISLDNVIGLLNLEAKGGKGGNSNYCNGLGGGGGGGFVWYTGPTLPLGTLTLSAGDPGITSMSPCTNIKPGFSGGSGDSANHLNPVLNGFLFNLIGISQTICNGEIPQKLTGTHPRGGNGVYTYQWQSRNRTSGYNWIDITGATNLEYSSPALYDTTDFRRIVNSVNINTGVPITDTSKWIKIKVRPEIKGLSIAPADTAICFNLPQVPIRGATAYGGDSSYSLVYLWEESLDNSTWVTASIPPTNGKDYTGTSNQTSKYYRRKVINNACTVVSNNSYITVYPSISGNQLQPDSVICNGSVPNSMRGVKTLSGGAGTGSYRYQWLKNSSDSLHWIQISASDTFQSYTPGALNNTIFYRRVVFSGLRNTCKDSSYRVKVNVLPSIANNFIHQDQTTICQNTRPNRFLGDQPTGGTNTYLYQWESSADNSAWTPLQQPKIDSVNYTNGIINIVAPAYFRRTIFSGAYNCCKNSSASIKIIVQPKIENNTIVDTAEICYGQTSPGLNQTSGLSLTGGDNTTYTYQWFRRPVDSTIWKDCFTAAPSYLPGALFKTNYYKRKVISGTCVSFSDSIKINVLPLISGNTKPGGRHEVCENAIPEAFIGPTVSGGKQGSYRYFWESSISGNTWDSIPGANDVNYTSSPLTQSTFFRRIVKSGYNNCCISVGDTFIMNVSKHPSIPEAGDAQKLSFKFTTTLHAKPVAIGFGTWTTPNEKINIENPRDTSTEVDNMPFGNNIFYWTTANGSCPAKTDSVLIQVDDIIRFNGFSPNNDGVNDQFFIEGAENSKVKKLKIFNRWGAEVYSSDNYQNDWEGTAKNGQPLPEDTYYYIFEADGNRIYKGFVIIKR